jgi:hypothetical protein
MIAPTYFGDKKIKVQNLCAIIHVINNNCIIYASMKSSKVGNNTDSVKTKKGIEVTEKNRTI